MLTYITNECMPDKPTLPQHGKTRILLEIDRKLPQLPPEQQNLVAAFAQGLLAGLALRAADGGVPPRATAKP